jgi:hypothetical protein
MYSKTDYKNAIDFALNYPPDYHLIKYDSDKDLFDVEIFDEGWYRMNLDGYFVRSCLNWKGEKKWHSE